MTIGIDTQCCIKCNVYRFTCIFWRTYIS